MVRRNEPEEAQPQDLAHDNISNSTFEGITIVDGEGGLGREPSRISTSETGVAAGGASSETGAIGDFDITGQAGHLAHTGVGGTDLGGQDGRDPRVDAATGLSGEVSHTRHHPGARLSPSEAADDAHTGAAFPPETH